MGALLESGMVGNIGLKHLRVIKEDTIKKWDELGFLENLEGHQKDNDSQRTDNHLHYCTADEDIDNAGNDDSN